EDARCISESQAGFRESRGAADKLLEITSEIRNRKGRGEKIYLLFVDLKKAYDSVEHHVLFATLTAMGVPSQIVDTLADLYKDNTCGVSTAWGLTEPFKVTRGLRQGCPASPPLFNLVIEPLISWTEHKLQKRHSRTAKERSTKILAYADDIAIISNSWKDINLAMGCLATFFNTYG